MDSRDALLLSMTAEMHSINARVESMKAANASAALQNLPPQYVFADFDAAARDLFFLSTQFRNFAG